MTDFRELVEKSPRGLHLGTTVALDPGETTGWSAWDSYNLVGSGQITTNKWPDAAKAVSLILQEYGPVNVVHETYRIYKWHTQDHTWSKLWTPRLIGGIEMYCAIYDFHLTGQTAQVAKNFCTDAFLNEHNLYKEGQVHARDAIRHGAYFLLFGAKPTTPPN